MQHEDPNKQAELDRLITAAHVHRRRGDYQQAEQAVKKALDIDPDNADAREFAADILYARGALEVAAEEYKRLYTEDGTRTGAEEKYARAVVQIAEGKRQKDLMREMLENPSKFRTPARNPFYAALLSFAPGLGHIYCGQMIKGIVLLAATGVSWWLCFALGGSTDYSGLADRAAESVDLAQRLTAFLTPGTILLGCIAIFLHIYALVDAPVLAGRLRGGEHEASPDPSPRASSEPQ